MPVVGIRELANKTSAVVDEVARSGRPALVTRHGRPVVAVVPVDEEDLLDFVLANAPEYVRAMDDADRAIAHGERGVPWEQVRDALIGADPDDALDVLAGGDASQHRAR